MELTARVLDPVPVTDLREWRAQGGLAALEVARVAGADAVISAVTASGLRGRGGAGFPTGVKWRSVAGYAAGGVVAPTVVVNGAEGEPGSFKDRAILLANPYRVIEGALIAALAVGADRVVLALKAADAEVIDHVRRAAAEFGLDGADGPVVVDVFEGPAAYLYGEETALLEVLDGRPPFPRIAPPYRRGVEDEGADPTTAGGSIMATGDGGSDVPPALVDNVETLANVPGIVANGPTWFRSIGTDGSPGSIVVTVSGATERAGVAEVPMGTTLREVIDEVGGGPASGRVVAVLPGVSGAFLPASTLDTPLTYEDMAAAGSGLGSCSFTVLDQSSDVVAVAHGASRFLAVESCGQCTACKQDGLAIAADLDLLRRNAGDFGTLPSIRDRLATITDGARCSLAAQHQAVVVSLLDLFPEAVEAHVEARAEPADQVLVAEAIHLDDEHLVADAGHLAKQPDWTHDDVDSGQAPADTLRRHASR